MPQIIHSDAGINPWAVAAPGISYKSFSKNRTRVFHDLLVMFCNTTLTSPAMFASQWLSDHAVNTEIVFIKFP